MRAWMLTLLAAGLVGCGEDRFAEHGECRMQAIQAKLPSQNDQVEFVDACMGARGYESHTQFTQGFALCDRAFGVRADSCYTRRPVMERIKAKLG